MAGAGARRVPRQPWCASRSHASPSARPRAPCAPVPVHGEAAQTPSPRMCPLLGAPVQASVDAPPQTSPRSWGGGKWRPRGGLRTTSPHLLPFHPSTPTSSASLSVPPTWGTPGREGWRRAAQLPSWWGGCPAGTGTDGAGPRCRAGGGSGIERVVVGGSMRPHGLRERRTRHRVVSKRV